MGKFIGQAERPLYKVEEMTTALDNDAFWRSNETHIAVNPHHAEDADGLLEFANLDDATRGLIFFQTSGSEGAPKWCGLSREAMLASARAVNSHFSASRDDRWLVALPTCHVGGFSIFARCHESGARTVHMNERWNARQFADLCRSNEITLTSLVPSQIFDLVQAELPAPTSLRAVIVGGGGLGQETGRRARDLGWPVLQSYGMTECASQVATEPLSHLQSGFQPDALEILNGWQLCSDRDDRLTVRGPALTSGWMVKLDGIWKWQPVLPTTGLVTRDRVKLWSQDGMNYLTYLGRDANFVKVLGELVSIDALQQRLDSICVTLNQPPGDVLVWPVDDARMGSRLILAGSQSSEDLEILRARFNSASPGHERLLESVRVPTVPKTAIGKTDRAALKEMLPT